MSFWVSLAGLDNNRVTGTDWLLSPAPSSVDYPTEPLGRVVDVPDGRAVVQQPAVDYRRRTWIWERYPSSQAGQTYPGPVGTYERQYQRLLALRSRHRVEQGLSPYIYVKDTVTRHLRRRVTAQYTLASSGNTTSVLSLASGTPWTGLTLEDAVVEVLPSTFGGTGTGQYQQAYVLSNTANTLTVVPLNTAPQGARITVQYWVSDWVRVRVVEVSRTVRTGGGPIMFDSTKFAFVLDDPTYTNVG